MAGEELPPMSNGKPAVKSNSLDESNTDLEA